jgi:hypothetical protein
VHIFGHASRGNPFRGYIRRPFAARANPPIEHPNLSGTWKLNVARSGPILPRGTEALTMVFEHRDPSIKYSETRTVSGKTTHSDGDARMIDGRLRVEHPAPRKTERSMQKWEGLTLVMHWELTDADGITYVSDIGRPCPLMARF